MQLRSTAPFIFCFAAFTVWKKKKKKKKPGLICQCEDMTGEEEGDFTESFVRYPDWVHAPLVAGVNIYTWNQTKQVGRWGVQWREAKAGVGV